MNTAEGIYLGRVIHKRVRPFSHRFTYRVFSLLLDIDRLDTLNDRFRWLKHNRFAPLSFFDRDHGRRDGSALRPWVEEAAAEGGVDLTGGKIYLLSFPRLWGYVFNPLSVYYGYGRDGQLRGLLYEVKNTFGDQLGYFLPMGTDDKGRMVPHQADKSMYVSPFMPMQSRYHFRGRVPGDTLSLAIRQSVDGAAALFASIHAMRKPLSDGAMLRAIAGNPLMTAKVTAGIHWEALHLFRKGAQYFSRPKPPENAISYPKPPS